MTKYLLLFLMITVSGTFTDSIRSASGGDESQFLDLLKTIKVQKEPDCNNDFFKSTSSPKSLMGWSNRFQEDVVLAVEHAKGNNDTGPILASADRACVKTIQYRGAASCLKPNNTKYRDDLMATVDMCHQLLIK